MKFHIVFYLFLTSIIVISCSSKHIEEIEINSHKSVYFKSKVYGVGGGSYNFVVTDNRYFNWESKTIDFGDIGNLPILYEIKDCKLIIHTADKAFDKNKMSDLINFKTYDNGFHYIQKLDSVKNGFSTNLKIYFPMDFYVNQSIIKSE